MPDDKKLDAEKAKRGDPLWGASDFAKPGIGVVSKVWIGGYVVFCLWCMYVFFNAALVGEKLFDPTGPVKAKAIPGQFHK